MTREWNSGDVALVQFDADENSRVEASAMFCRGGWMSETNWVVAKDVVVIRPLVVIDPDDDAQVERLASQLVYAGYTPDTGTVAAALRTLIAEPKPPKPAEPQGLGAVVEDTEGDLWIRVRDDGGGTTQPWRLCSGSMRGWFRNYDELDVARKLSEGWAE